MDGLAERTTCRHHLLYLLCLAVSPITRTSFVIASPCCHMSHWEVLDSLRRRNCSQIAFRCFAIPMRTSVQKHCELHRHLAMLPKFTASLFTVVFHYYDFVIICAKEDLISARQFRPYCHPHRYTWCEDPLQLDSWDSIHVDASMKLLLLEMNTATTRKARQRFPTVKKWYYCDRVILASDWSPSWIL